MKESQRKHRLGVDRIVLAADSQALHAFEACHRRYWLGQAEHLVPIHTKKAYEIGNMIHDIMHRVTRAKLRRPGLFTNMHLLKIGYKRIDKARKAGLFVDKKSKKPETRAKNEEETYLFHITRFTQWMAWLEIQDRFYKPLGSEVGFSKVLYENMDVVFVYEGRIDLVLRVEPAGFRTWADYKTQSREYQLYPNRNQFLGYSWALDSNIGYIVYYGLQEDKDDQKLKADSIFKYHPIYHNPLLVEQWRQDTIRQFHKIVSLAPFGEKEFERNRASCDAGKFGLCPYTILCDNAWAPPQVQKGLRRIFFKESEWTPWK